MKWTTLSTDEAAPRWDEHLAVFKDNYIKQSWSWGSLKSSSWEILPTVLLNGPTPMAMALCLLRRAPLGAATAVWINGGPVFEKNRPRGQDLAFLAKFLEGLKEHLGHYQRPVVRLNLGQPMDMDVQLVLREAGFIRPLMPLDTGLTYIVDLSRDLEELHAGLERNWRNQLRAAEKGNPTITFGRDRALLERYLILNNELVARKGLDDHKLSMSDLERMAAELGERIVFMVISVEGKDGCGGALWTFGGKAYFALSSANDWGLAHQLPNFMYWRAIAHLKEKDCREFDLTGIDPRRNWGVFNFKRGLKARAVETLGEWEWSPSDWARRGFNAALWAAGKGPS